MEKLTEKGSRGHDFTLASPDLELASFKTRRFLCLEWSLASFPPLWVLWFSPPVILSDVTSDGNDSFVPETPDLSHGVLPGVFR